MTTRHDPVSADSSAILADLARELDRYRLDASTAPTLRSALLAFGEFLGALPSGGRDHPSLARARELARGVWDSGYLGRSVPVDDLVLAARLAAAGPAGFLAATALVPHWQWSAAPELDRVPDTLWGHYVAWAFVAPCAASELGAADLHLAKLEELAEAVDRWAGRNLGSPGVRDAVEAFLRHRRADTPVRSSRPLRRWAVADAGVFSKSMRHRRDPAPPVAFDREGRALRIGVLRADWGESLAVRALLPRITALDPSAFSLHLFAERGVSDVLEQHCKRAAASFDVLPAKTPERVAHLRASGLDVLVFAGPLATNAEFQLALHRVAPLQIATDECPGTTGLPEIDLHLTGLDTAANEFTEAVGRLAGPAFVWDGDAAPAAFEGPSRAELGLPDNGAVLVSAPQLSQIGAELLHAWAGILRAEPGSSLLLLLPADTDTFALETRFDRFNAVSGIEPSRIVLSLGDPRCALKHGDVYLDTFPRSSPAPLLAALAADLPAVVWEGTAHGSRTGAAVLRSLGRGECVATDAAGYVAHARRLIADPAARADARRDFSESIERGRGLGDAPVASLAFGDVVATAYDRLATGRSLPRKVSVAPSAEVPKVLEERAESALKTGDAKVALDASADFLRAAPDSARARSLRGRAHLLAGHAAPAVACFFSALRGRESEVEAWLDLGSGLRAQRDHSGAIEAYETALRLDQTCLDGWIAIAELARAGGAHELAEDALGVARRIDGRDPRLLALAS